MNNPYYSYNEPMFLFCSFLKDGKTKIDAFTEAQAKAKAELLESFGKEYKMVTAHKKTLGQIFDDIMDMKGFTGKNRIAKAEKLTGLNKNIFSNIKNKSSDEYDMKMNTLMSIIIGFELNSSVEKILYEATGLTLVPTSRVHQAYEYLLDNYRFAGIGTCNAVLRDLGIDEKHLLGSLDRETGMHP